ncbi:DNA (cytosine-5-)-methyltransferase [bacterium]|nr:DNA (cytosine-5-)-methyltransferase [bacterium]
MSEGTCSFRLGELFSGPGGLSLGATNSCIRYKGVEYRIVSCWANDIDADSCATFRRNICPQSPELVINRDVRSLDIDSLRSIDALAFGFPCNDYSMVGEQLGLNGNFGPLYRYGVRVLEVHKPVWFVAENVSGLRSANEGRAFVSILDDLKHAGFGYNLTAHLYKFEDYGVPQTRHRVLIVGIRTDLDLKFKVPAPTTPEFRKTAYDALECPPIPHDAANHEHTRQSKSVIERLRHIPPGGNAWHENVPRHLRLNVPNVRMSHIYKRLDPYKPAYTVTGSGGGGTHVYHWKEPRALTNRERARLQTFPDTFVFEGSKESVRKQIGMAVPPHAARLICTSVLKTLVGVSYDHVEANLDHIHTQSDFLDTVRTLDEC